MSVVGWILLAALGVLVLLLLIALVRTLLSGARRSEWKARREPERRPGPGRAEVIARRLRTRGVTALLHPGVPSRWRPRRLVQAREPELDLRDCQVPRHTHRFSKETGWGRLHSLMPAGHR